MTCSPTPTPRSHRSSIEARRRAASCFVELASTSVAVSPPRRPAPSRRRDPRLCDRVPGRDLDAFLGLLAEDVVLTFDGGPEVRTAARHPIVGADRVARFLTFVMNRLDDHGRVVVSTLNGGTGALVYARDDLIGAVFVEPSEDGRAAEIRWVRNPEKLVGLSSKAVTLSFPEEGRSTNPESPSVKD